MKYSKAYFESIAVVVMLAELPAGRSLKSKEISDAMEVSHSYLQKIANKLNKAGIIESTASKNGGFAMKANIHSLSLYDLFVAIEGDEPFGTGYNREEIEKMFITSKNIELSISKTSQMLITAEEAMKNSLKEQRVAEIIPRDEEGNLLEIDWQTLIGK